MRSFTSCELRSDAKFKETLYFVLFKEKDHFEELFLPCPDIDFSRYAVGAILQDSIVDVPENGKIVWQHINASLKLDSFWLKDDCNLLLSFTARRLEDSVPPDGYKKKFLLFKVPRDSGIARVSLINSRKTAGWSFEMD